MKSNKKFIIGMLSGVLLASTVGVVAVKLTAKEIPFTSEDVEWQVDNVEDAMNDLYASSKESKKILIAENYVCNGSNKISGTGGYGAVMKHAIDVSSIDGYDELEVDDFIIEVVEISGGCNAKTSATRETSKEYDKETGILTLNNYGYVWNQQTNNGYSDLHVVVNVWLVK